MAFSLHHLGGKREERLSGPPPPTPLTSPTFSWHPSVQPAVSRSSTVLPCGLRAQPTMWCCGAAGRGLVQLSHSSAADCQPGPARPGPDQPGSARQPLPTQNSPLLSRCSSHAVHLSRPSRKLQVLPSRCQMSHMQSCCTLLGYLLLLFTPPPPPLPPPPPPPSVVPLFAPRRQHRNAVASSPAGPSCSCRLSGHPSPGAPVSWVVSQDLDQGRASDTHAPPKGQQLCCMSGWAALPQAVSPGQQVLTGGAAATLAQEEEEEKRVYVVPPSAEVASVFV